MDQLLDPRLDSYIAQHSGPEPEIRRRLAAETYEVTEAPQMLCGHVEARFLQLMLRMVNARRVLEIGTFTGYSALAMAEALPDDGEVITCDVNERTTAIAKQFWARSPHGKKITLKLGPALETIPTLENHFDAVFIDADKPNYKNYWELCVPRVRPGGVLLVDNVLWSGGVLEPKTDMDRLIDAFNKHVARDQRVDATIASIRDGVTVAIRN